MKYKLFKEVNWIAFIPNGKYGFIPNGIKEVMIIKIIVYTIFLHPGEILILQGCHNMRRLLCQEC